MCNQLRKFLSAKHLIFVLTKGLVNNEASKRGELDECWFILEIFFFNQTVFQKHQHKALEMMI